jgi:heme/copper-type cytochrome/quinol oxidase subunit 3
VARAILLAATIAWGLAAVLTLGLAALGAERLEGALPPLSIDTDALRGALVAVGVAMTLTAGAHAFVVVGLRAGRHRAWSAGILLAGLLAAMFVALAAAAFTSAIATPASAPPLVGAGVGASIGAVAYGVITAGLVGELRSGSAV